MEIPIDDNADFRSLRVTYINQIVELGATVKKSGPGKTLIAESDHEM